MPDLTPIASAQHGWPVSIVFSTGCPRSGTTLVAQMLANGVAYTYQRVIEGSAANPVVSSTGLVDLVDTFRSQRVQIVRTVREPLDVAQSYWSVNAKVYAGYLDELVRVIVATVWAERDNVARQRVRLADVDLGDRLVQFRYEDLGDPARRGPVLDRLTEHLPAPLVNRIRFANFIDEHWHVKPLGDGRLTQGRGGQSVIPEPYLTRIVEQLPAPERV